VGVRPASGSRLPGIGLVRRIARLRTAWLRGSLHARAGGLALYDRHPLEASMGTPSLRRRILARSCPPPDLAIVLDAPAGVLAARKAEHDAVALGQQREAYLALAARRGATVVDATAPPAAVLRAVLAVISPRLEERLAGERSRR
jgi:hypothetical protein